MTKKRSAAPARAAANPARAKAPAMEGVAPVAGIVNVIFRGLFIYVQKRNKLRRPSYVEIVMPNVGEEHVYKAGGFLQQSTLGPSLYPYGITNIDGGKAEFDGKKNIILKDMPLAQNLTPAQIYAKFVLPQPIEILSLGVTSPLVAAVDPLDLFEGRRMSSVQVLRYKSDDLSRVRLYPHRGVAKPHQNEHGNFLNIHISNDEDFDQSEGHTGYAIDRMFDLIPCLNCKVRLAYWEFPAEDYSGLPRYGLIPEEVLNSRDLHQRTLSAYASGLRQGAFTVSPPQGCVGAMLDEG
jgi:hypothetical protein